MSLPRKSRYLKIAPKGGARAPHAPRRGPLVMVDAGPIRAAATRKYRQAQVRFTEAQKALTRFQEKDKPKFERWLQQNFRSLVSELRTAQSKLSDLRELVFEVETRTWFRNQSAAAAYRDILDRKARRNKGEEEPEPDDLEEALRARMRADEDEAEAERAEAEAAAAEAASSLPTRTGKKQLPPDKEARLKAAYRSMARRLHPDRVGAAQITPQMRERWHAAQAAYLAGDVDLLESLETLCIDEEEVDGATPISLILARTGRLLTSLSQLMTKTQHCRKDPAWSFSAMTDEAEVGRIERLMAKTLPVQLKTAKGEIAELEAKIAGWRADAERFYSGFKEAHAPRNGVKAESAKTAKPRTEKKAS